MVHVQAGHIAADVGCGIASHADIIAALDRLRIVVVLTVNQYLGRKSAGKFHDPVPCKTGLTCVGFTIIVYTVAVCNLHRKAGVCAYALRVEQLREACARFLLQFCIELCKTWVWFLLPGLRINRHFGDSDCYKITLRLLAFVGAGFHNKGLPLVVFCLWLENIALHQAADGGYKLNCHF